MVQRDLNHLDILWSTTLIHYINDIMLIKQVEQEVASKSGGLCSRA